MKIGVVGTGISGLLAARILSKRHSVTVFEADGRIGGHTHTVPVQEGERVLPVDTGFIVFNRANYPNLCRLFDELGVQTRDSDMSFSVRCERSGLEYNGTSIDTLFAQRNNLLNPSHWCMLKDIVRFNRQAPKLLGCNLSDDITVADFIRKNNYSEAFKERYLIPLGASLWSVGGSAFDQFPIRFVIEFLHNHSMLTINDRPVWQTVVGGSSSYLAPLIEPFEASVRCNSPVHRVRRNKGAVEVDFGAGESARFDEVVLACHADQALKLVHSPDSEEQQMLRLFPYSKNEVALHTDTSLLPARRRAWASWNYLVPANSQASASVTYDMTRLQGLDTEQTYCVSLNSDSRVDPAKVIQRFVYEHPMFTPGRRQAQQQHERLIRRAGISYCGAYWGYGFHEDGVSSALDITTAFDLDMAA